MAPHTLPTVLVADDEESVLSLMETVLARRGQYRLLLARNGEEALTIAQRELPDLVLADVSMPKLNGFDLCRRLKQEPATAGIKVVLLSGFIEVSYRKRMLEAGADDIFPKPFDLYELREKLENTWLASDPD